MRIRPLLAAVLAAGVAVVPSPAPGEGVASDAILVSVGLDGAPADGPSEFTSTSAEGSRIVFLSSATNLVGNDTNGEIDAFVRDIRAGWTRRVSVTSETEQLTMRTWDASISGNGRWVAFSTADPNVLPHDGDVHADIFLHDLADGSIERVSPRRAVRDQKAGSRSPQLSYDGRFVTFSTLAPFLRKDHNAENDTYMLDRRQNILSLVTATDYGTHSDGYSADGHLSADGGCFAFPSLATNLDPADPGEAGIYLRDLRNMGTRSFRDRHGERRMLQLGGMLTSDGGSIAYPDDDVTVPGHDGQSPDLWVTNLRNGSEEIVSKSTSGNPASIAGFSMSGSGKRFAMSLVVRFGDYYKRRLVVRDRSTDRNLRVDLGPSGERPDRATERISMSLDSTHVAFTSAATNLTPDDNNGMADVFARETGFESDWTHPTERRGCGDGFAGRRRPKCFGREATIVGTRRGDDLSSTEFPDVIHGRGSGDGLRGGEYMCGARGADRITGYSGSQRLSGGPGADYLYGGEGYDVCYGGPGTDEALFCEETYSIP